MKNEELYETVFDTYQDAFKTWRNIESGRADTSIFITDPIRLDSLYTVENNALEKIEDVKRKIIIAQQEIVSYTSDRDSLDTVFTKIDTLIRQDLRNDFDDIFNDLRKEELNINKRKERFERRYLLVRPTAYLIEKDIITRNNGKSLDPNKKLPRRKNIKFNPENLLKVPVEDFQTISVNDKNFFISETSRADIISHLPTPSGSFETVQSGNSTSYFIYDKSEFWGESVFVVVEIKE